MLDSMGAVQEAQVADLFAGSGALGIEALSRGAAAVTFVDNDPRALAAVRANLEVLGPGGGGRARLVRADVPTWVAANGGSAPGTGDATGAFDLVLCDPPYGFDRWGAVYAGLGAGLVVAESDAPVDPPAGWRTLRVRRYGSTVVTLACPLNAPPPKGTE